MPSIALSRGILSSARIPSSSRERPNDLQVNKKRTPPPNREMKANLYQDLLVAHMCLHRLRGTDQLARMASTIIIGSVNPRPLSVSANRQTEAQRHHLSLNPKVKNTSPVPRLVS